MHKHMKVVTELNSIDENGHDTDNWRAKKLNGHWKGELFLKTPVTELTVHNFSLSFQYLGSHMDVTIHGDFARTDIQEYHRTELFDVLEVRVASNREITIDVFEKETAKTYPVMFQNQDHHAIDTQVFRAQSTASDLMAYRCTLERVVKEQASQKTVSAKGGLETEHDQGPSGKNGSGETVGNGERSLFCTFLLPVDDSRIPVKAWVGMYRGAFSWRDDDGRLESVFGGVDVAIGFHEKPGFLGIRVGEQLAQGCMSIQDVQYDEQQNSFTIVMKEKQNTYVGNRLISLTLAMTRPHTVTLAASIPHEVHRDSDFSSYRATATLQWQADVQDASDASFEEADVPRKHGREPLSAGKLVLYLAGGLLAFVLLYEYVRILLPVAVIILLAWLIKRKR